MAVTPPLTACARYTRIPKENGIRNSARHRLPLLEGLSDLPWLGRFFSQNSHDKQSTEILIVLKPHLVTPSPWDFVSRAIWVGSEAKPVTMF